MQLCEYNGATEVLRLTDRRINYEPNIRTVELRCGNAGLQFLRRDRASRGTRPLFLSPCRYWQSTPTTIRGWTPPGTVPSARRRSRPTAGRPRRTGERRGRGGWRRRRLDSASKALPFSRNFGLNNTRSGGRSVFKRVGSNDSETKKTTRGHATRPNLFRLNHGSQHCPLLFSSGLGGSDSPSHERRWPRSILSAEDKFISCRPNHSQELHVIKLLGLIQWSRGFQCRARVK